MFAPFAYEFNNRENRKAKSERLRRPVFTSVKPINLASESSRFTTMDEMCAYYRNEYVPGMKISVPAVQPVLVKQEIEPVPVSVNTNTIVRTKDDPWSYKAPVPVPEVVTSNDKYNSKQSNTKQDWNTVETKKKTVPKTETTVRGNSHSYLCNYAENCRFIRVRDGRVQNNTFSDRVCKFQHPGETSRQLQERVTMGLERQKTDQSGNSNYSGKTNYVPKDITNLVKPVNTSRNQTRK